ncbi:MAG: hypothetical protein V4565_05080 [Bacteroidota bacterium]
MGIKEWFNQTVEDLDNRFRNPLILSFVIVWLINNWELVYMIFNFNANYSLNLKLLDLKFYLSSKDSCTLLWMPIGFAFISLFGFYVIGVASQLMKLFIGTKLPLYLMGRHDNSKYVYRTELEKFEKSSNQYFKELREKQSELIDMKDQTDKDLKTIISNKEEIEDLKNKKSDLAMNLNSGIAQTNDLQNKLNEAVNKFNAMERQYELVTAERDKTKIELERNEKLRTNSNSIHIDSDDLGKIFRESVVWDFYLNDKKIESIRYNSKEKVMYSSHGSIRITNVKITESGVILFEKNTPKISKLPLALIMTDENTLVGVEGTKGENKAKYVKTDKRILL